MRKLTRRDFLRMSSALAAGTALAACAAPAAPIQEPTTAPATGATPTATGGGTMVFPWWFWEIVSEHAWSMHKVPRLVGGRLVDIDLDGSITPNLAERWELSDDRLTYTFHLRRGVTWHDGETFDANDVAFTINYLVNEQNRNASGTTVGWGSLSGAMEYRTGEADSIAGLEVVDDYTVRMTLPTPNGGWLTLVPTHMNILPEHVYNAIPIENIQEDYSPNWFQPHMHIGTGPFKWVEGEVEQFVRLERFDDYWMGRPQLDGILFQNVGETDTRFLALQRGEIDYLDLAGDYYRQALTFDHVEVKVFERPYHRWLTINLDRPHWQDVRVRRALNHAVDRQLLCDTVYAGLAEPWHSFMEHTRWLNEDLPQYDYDPEQARALLAEAAADGAWDPSREIELAFYYPDTLSRDFMAGLQQYFTSVGINTRLAYYESAPATDKTDTGDFDLMYSGWGAAPEPDAYARGFDCADPASIYFRSYLPELCQQVQALFEQGKQLSDFAERKAIYDEIQNIYGENALAVPLFRFRSAAGLNKRIGGFGLGALAWQSSWVFSNHKAHEWHITG